MRHQPSHGHPFGAERPDVQGDRTGHEPADRFPVDGVPPHPADLPPFTMDPPGDLPPLATEGDLPPLAAGDDVPRLTAHDDLPPLERVDDLPAMTLDGLPPVALELTEEPERLRRRLEDAAHAANELQAALFELEAELLRLQHIVRRASPAMLQLMQAATEINAAGLNDQR